MPEQKYTACIIHRVARILRRVLKYGKLSIVALFRESARAFAESVRMTRFCRKEKSWSERSQGKNALKYKYCYIVEIVLNYKLKYWC